MNLKQILYTDLCMVGNKQTAAWGEYQRTVSKFDLTDEGKAEVRKNLFTDITEEAKSIKAEGEKTLDEAIQRVTAEEAAAPANRASNDYLKRLELKIDMARNVDKNDVSTATMRKYLEEFANDPMASAALKARLPKEYVGAIPDDNTGFRVKHLKVVKVLFKRYMDRSVEVLGHANPNQSEGHIELLTAEIEAFKQYVLVQNEDFTLDDEYILDGIAAKSEALRIAAGKLKMDFSVLMMNADKL